MANWPNNLPIPTREECAALRARVSELEAEITALRARLEIDPAHRVDGIEARDETIRLQNSVIAELRKDAERYRWLRAYGGNWIAIDVEIEALMSDPNNWNFRATLDAAIDAAIASEKENERG